MYNVKKLPKKLKVISDCCPSIKKGGKFINPWPSSKSQSKKKHFFETYLRFITRRSFRKQPEEKFVKVDVDLKSLNEYSQNQNDVALQVTWLGHAATFLQINGFNILFDPLLSFRASPFPFIGPYRYRKRGFKSFSDLPQIDILIISHNHYDHLDKKTIKEMLEEEKNKQIHIFCPLGIKKWFLKHFNLENKQITEGDWWDDFEIIKNKTISEKQKIQVSFVPAQHSSRRGLFDCNKSLWGGWVIKSDDASFYFAGDTGYRAIPENCSNNERLKYPYCPLFTQIGKIYGPFDYACIPIGPSNNTNIVTPMHVDPTDAINIHKEIYSHHSIPIHWGTVANFSTIEITHDPQKLRQSMKNSGLPLEEFDVAYIGEIYRLNKKDTLKVKVNKQLQ
ncbi:Metallo-hydrolase/oxidoreductase [Piromyces finnis]|uniref:Metallo-hydrolase/oxidoreductase n=1 Tax=Piromyces finnis TaxID=1754191 RepID=A0A1Y1V0A5_9FUNG|nr:Metallo-hydrolase/oxidoreductase [Piromyces finnis]|eukprot:ORX44521.1 Metallo-hydrolase/oxidoreductase [Piromyces finnis]